MGRPGPQATDFILQALRSLLKSRTGREGANNVIRVLFIQSLQREPEWNGQGSLVEATGKTSRVRVKKAALVSQEQQMAVASESVWRDSPFRRLCAILCSQSSTQFTCPHRASGPHNYPGIRHYHPVQTKRFRITKGLTQWLIANKR